MIYKYAAARPGRGPRAKTNQIITITIIIVIVIVIEIGMVITIIIIIIVVIYRCNNNRVF